MRESTRDVRKILCLHASLKAQHAHAALTMTMSDTKAKDMAETEISPEGCVNSQWFSASTGLTDTTPASVTLLGGKQASSSVEVVHTGSMHPTIPGE